jgi:hypothetical protein
MAIYSNESNLHPIFSPKWAILCQRFIFIKINELCIFSPRHLTKIVKTPTLIRLFEVMGGPAAAQPQWNRKSVWAAFEVPFRHSVRKILLPRGVAA